jgi:CHAT domain-containing protein
MRALLASIVIVAAAAAPAFPSVVVEQVGQGWAAARGGLRAGDVLNAVPTPFDAWILQIDEGLRGPTAVDVTRDGLSQRLTIPAGSWGLYTRPQLHGAAQTSWDEAAARLRAGNADVALESWRQTVERLPAGAWRERAAVWSSAGQVCAEARQWPPAERAYEAAVEILTAQGAPTDLGVTLTWLAKARFQQSEYARAATAAEQAVAAFERERPESLPVAAALQEWADAVLRREDHGGALRLALRSQTMRTRLAPGTVADADGQSTVGYMLASLGDPAGMESLRRAVEILEVEAPGSLDLAGVLGGLAGELHEIRNLEGAEELHRRELAIVERLVPADADFALNGLGVLALFRREPEVAEGYLRRALELRRKKKLESIPVGRTSDLLAAALLGQERLEEGRAGCREAIRILRAAGPKSGALARALLRYGDVLAQDGDLAQAEAQYREALQLVETRPAMGSFGVLPVRALAHLALKRGDLEAAGAGFQKALATSSLITPGSEDEANDLHGLGAVERRRGRYAEAAELFRRAIDAIETQTGRLGASEDVRSGFKAEFKPYYVDYLETLLELGREAEAFQAGERYRARSFLAMLAERDLALGGDIPEGLAREAQDVDARYAKVQARLSQMRLGVAGSDPEPLLAQRRELMGRKVEMRRRIREASPRLAALQYPEPASLVETVDRLDRGTALLSFVVGESQTLLFVVTPGAERPLSILRLPCNAADLEARVRAFSALVRRRTSEAVIVEAARRLYDELLGSAEPLIARSARIVIVPDGPLHRLPFAALVRRIDRRGRPEYLVEWKPPHVVLSATVYAELLKSRRAVPQERTLVAFGDPAYPRARGEAPEPAALRRLRSAAAGGALAPLPFSRREVESIAELYPDASSVFLADEATEERAKERSGAGRYVHFACHGLLDEHLPINSALVLTVPVLLRDGQDDGLLQAWEILEKVRLDADLVTLSACETALGTELGGDGLIGLTRAFQYAGAHSVLASQWAVDDASTAELMRRFYRHLKLGKAKADALRAAQLELLRGATSTGVREGSTARGVGARVADAASERSHPFRWAAFQLVGDWR